MIKPSRDIGVVAHTSPMPVTQLREATTYDDPNPFTVIDLGGLKVHINCAEDGQRLLLVLQNAVVRQQMAEAKARRDREEVAR